jgi:hypothetical protein
MHSGVRACVHWGVRAGVGATHRGTARPLHTLRLWQLTERPRRCRILSAACWVHCAATPAAAQDRARHSGATPAWCSAAKCPAEPVRDFGNFTIVSGNRCRFVDVDVFRIDGATGVVSIADLRALGEQRWLHAQFPHIYGREKGSRSPGMKRRSTLSRVMTTIRMQPPEEPSRAMAWETAARHHHSAHDNT